MNLKKMLFPSSDDNGAAPAGQPTCPVGHALDPSWGGVCPYCTSEARAKTKTEPVSKLEVPRAAADERKTMVAQDGPPPSSRRETRVDSSGAAGAYREPTDGRRITGILATFSWKTTGEVFVLREGKNTIGSGTVNDEGHRPCDVQIKVDPEMSKEHALILCRQGRYELVDLNSSNGTFLEGEMIPSHAVELKNDARIKVGATVLQFLKIEGGRGAGAERAQAPDEPDNPDVPNTPPPARGPGRLTSVE